MKREPRRGANLEELIAVGVILLALVAWSWGR